ncbi:MAG: UvrD-helicase domain-containing protein [Methylobacteriaceae bacterium]|jgi:ATP-dependent helicase/nuclease subunit A|nr:UvrD-helicase domain-containing protein [Methylobacteriaceae bacterium]
MSPVFNVPEETIRAQRTASDPALSAWVAANAGAGKTKVLADRVVRLMLAGTPPSRILCLTFTKAAAAEMSLRVIRILSDWVTLDDAELSRALEKLEGHPPDADKLAEARRLFARAVETPGGLKIETLHAFCERILHMAPFEADVPAEFSVLEDETASELLAKATEIMLGEAVLDAGGPLSLAYAHASEEAGTLDKLKSVIAEALRRLPELTAAGGREVAVAAIFERFGISPDETIESIERAIMDDGLSTNEIRDLADQLRTGKTNDKERADALEQFLAAGTIKSKLEAMEKVFFTGEGEPRDDTRIVSKNMNPQVKAVLLAERDRFGQLRDRLRALAACRRTDALLRLADRVYQLFTEAKVRMSALDFDDLIRKTLEVLERGDTAWILYKLDRGIDHILIDEAQDTSPEQWRILRRITEEFTAGSGAAGNRARTVFAVGDLKQSIYSFQGAEPREFEDNRKIWSRMAEEARQPFANVTLNLSFRSTPTILETVDTVFSLSENYRGLGFDDAAVGTVHESARDTEPGLVELWPVTVAGSGDTFDIEEGEDQGIEDEEAGVQSPRAGENRGIGHDGVNAGTFEFQGFFDTDDENGPGGGMVDEPPARPEKLLAWERVAKRIAAAINSWMVHGDVSGRRWKPGDILILVRKRNSAFEAVIRALKQRNIPVAGQDRLNIAAHIAVMDLISAGRAALLPEDDLTLAEALKSPLVGLDDADLERLAASRQPGVSLWRSLHSHAGGGDDAAMRAVMAVRSWQELAAHRGGFGFYSALLGAGGARALLVARLGQEAADAIDAFVSFARSWEFSATPSLANFLAAFEQAEHTIKRDMEASRNEVRVMTVHGAKGLEAPVVILLDGGMVFSAKDALVDVHVPQMECPVPVWSPSKHEDSALIGEFRFRMRNAQLDEHHRLLYVAITRPRDKLVIAPFAMASRKNVAENSWAEMIGKGFVHRRPEPETVDTPYGTITVCRDTRVLPKQEPRAAPEPLPDVPGWLYENLAEEREPVPPLRPSRLGAAEFHEPGDSRESVVEARRRAHLIRVLLQRLPAVEADRRLHAAKAYLAVRAPALSEEEHKTLAEQALQVMARPDLAPVFAPVARTDTALSGIVEVHNGSFPVSGRIDRMAVSPDCVWMVSFRPDPIPPEGRSGVGASRRVKLAMHVALLEKIYPGRTIRAFLLYTAGPTVIEFTQGELRAALWPQDDDEAE